MRRINKAMRDSIEYSSLMDWTLKVNEADAKILQLKDQREERK